MTPDLEKQALSIVLRLAETDDARREHLRNELCGSNTQLLDLVRRMWLAHQIAEGSFLEHPALAEDESAASATRDLHAAERVSGEPQPKLVDRADEDAAVHAKPWAGRMLPVDCLGAGGQGEVWLVRDPAIDRLAAMKVMRRSHRRTREMLAKFRREAELTGKLEHPNIVPVYDVIDELSSTGQPDPDSPCYVMRAFGDRRLLAAIEIYHARPRRAEDGQLIEALRAFHLNRSAENRHAVERAREAFDFNVADERDARLQSLVEAIVAQDSVAGSLKQVIARFHAEPWSDHELRKLLDRFQRVCEAVAFAHSRGVIHRDLKPDNVMLGDFGETLVVDWGLAKVIGAEHPPEATDVFSTTRSDSDGLATAAGSIMGTPAFMAPEQASGEVDRLDQRTDIYALGAMLYVLLTGQPPLTARSNGVPESPPRKRLTAREVVERAARGEFPRPSDVSKHVPRPLESRQLLTVNVVESEPNDDFASADESFEFAAPLDRLVHDPQLTIYDANEQQIDYGVIDRTSGFTLDLQLAEGDYFFSVGAPTNTSNSDVEPNYTVTITRTVSNPPANEEVEPNDSFSHANDLGILEAQREILGQIEVDAGDSTSPVGERVRIPNPDDPLRLRRAAAGGRIDRQPDRDEAASAVGRGNLLPRYHRAPKCDGFKCRAQLRADAQPAGSCHEHRNRRPGSGTERLVRQRQRAGRHS